MAKIKINNVRISFSNIWKAKSYNDGDPKYNLQVILPKDHPQMADLEAAVLEAARGKFASKIKGNKFPASLKSPLRDGDIEREDYPETYEGQMFFNASSKNRPLVLDQKKNALAEEDGIIYDGCFCNVLINPYAFDVNGNKGVAVGVSGLQFKRGGEPLGTGGASVDDFDEEEGEEDDSLY